MPKKFKITVPALVYASFFIEAEDAEDAEEKLHSLSWGLNEGMAASVFLTCEDVRFNLTTQGELNFEGTDIIEI